MSRAAALASALAVASLGCFPAPLLLTPAAAGSAAAAAFTRAEVASLAERAASGDRAALATLRRVQEVDGGGVDLGLALTGARGEELDRRLGELAGAAGEPIPPGLPDPGVARAQAREALAEAAEPPPASGSSGSVELPSIGTPLAIALAAIAVLAGALVATRLAGRRLPAPPAPRGRAGASEARARGAADLERDAEAAERRGEFDVAVRLRFLAGLDRLDRLGAVRLRPSLTAAGAARELRSRQLAALAATFDELLFGGRRATAGDAREAREGWPSVLAEARR